MLPVRVMKLQTTAALGLLLLGPVGLAAQDRTEFSQLQTKLKQDDTLLVETASGMRIRGKLMQISAERIVLQTDNGLENIAAPQAVKVQRRHNGVLLGAIIGTGASIPFALFINRYSYNEGGNAGPAIAVLGVGLAAGVAIDAVLPSMRTVYDSNAKPRVEIRPILNSNQVGGEVAFSF